MKRAALGRFVLQLAILPVLSLPSLAQEDVDEIVRRHIEARGGYDAIKAIETLVFSEGVYREGDFVGGPDAFMAYKRPFYRLIGNPEQPGSFMEGYDGATWEWYANPGVVLRTVGAASGAIRHGAVFEGPFVDYRARGTTITLGEPAVVDGRPAHRLHVTLRDGFGSEALIDAESYLVVASRSAAPIHAFGAEVVSESRFGDYREVAGVLFAFHDVSIESATGEVLSEMRWGRIQAGRDLPDAWFSPPRFERTPLQRFVEQLFVQRSDPAAMLWTYHDYRSLLPSTDTRRGVEFIGYHMLKMGNAAEAIPLLEANVADHSTAASALFELGRALQSAGELDDARWRYEQALALDGNTPARSRRSSS